MCNLYSVTKGKQAIAKLFDGTDSATEVRSWHITDSLPGATASL